MFGKPLRACEILKIWTQHQGIEQYWRRLKTDLHLSSMSLEDREGAYANLGIKVMSYLLLLKMSMSTRCSFHQIQLRLTGQRDMLYEILTHFHDINTEEPSLLLTCHNF